MATQSRLGERFVAAKSHRRIGSNVNYVSLLGSMAFIAGLIIAFIAGIWWEGSDKLTATLVLLGLVVGLLNITGKEVIPYLVAAVALVLIGQADPPIFSSLATIHGGMADNLNFIVSKLAVFAAPAALVSAIRAAVALGRPGQTE